MPRFDRTYSLVVGSPSKSGPDRTRDAADRAEGKRLLAESKRPGLSAAENRAYALQQSAIASRLEARRDTGAAAGDARGGVEITGLRIAFDVIKTDTKAPNRSRIEVWNAAPATRAIMEQPDARCVLKAGYAEESGPLELFRGDITYAWTRYDGPDVVTEMELGDGARANRDSVVSLGYGPGVGTRRALKEIADKMGLALSMPDDAPVRTWKHGLSLHGSARTALDKITRGSGLSWSIQSGALQVLATGGVSTRNVVELAVDSGLIGSPERQRKGEREAVQLTGDKAADEKKTAARVKSASEAWDGWLVKSLLLPTIVPGDRVKLTSRTVDALLRVRELRHTGDTEASGDWITELRLQDVERQLPSQFVKAAKKAKKGKKTDAEKEAAKLEAARKLIAKADGP